MPSGDLENVRCNLCGADDSRVLYDSPIDDAAPGRVADYMASTNKFGRYGRIVRCRRCRLVYTNPRPAPATLRGGYEAAVDSDYAEEDFSRSINAHLSLRTIRKLMPSGRLLDVGCSTGFFLNAARLDFEVYGVEPSRWAVDYARRRLRLAVHLGGIEDGGFDDSSFDVISMNDVIEHLTDPRAALGRVHRLLRPGGVLYLVTPDISGLAARVLRGKWWGLRPAHVYYFSRATLQRMLEEAGFRIVLSRSYGRMFTYGYWLGRLQGYPRLIHRTAARAIRLLRIEEKLLYLDTRDSIELCALKTAENPGARGDSIVS